VSYTLYGVPVTHSLIRSVIFSFMQIMFVALVIYNWRYFPPQTGTIHLPPPDPPGPL